MQCRYDGCHHHAVSRGLCTGHRSQRERGVGLSPLGPRGPRPSGRVPLRVTVSPYTLTQLGNDPAARARQILEACTGTAPPVDCDRNTEAEMARDLRLRTDTDWD